MLENLFSSKILFKVLAVLFRHQEKSYSTTEIIKLTGKNQVNVLRELEKLINWGMVKKEKKNNQNYYELNQHYEYFDQLKELFKKHNLAHNRKYFLLNEEGSPALLALNFFEAGYGSDLGVKKGILPAQQTIISHYKNNYVWFYFEKSAFEFSAKESLKKLLADPSFVDQLIYPELKRLGQEGQALYGDLLKKNFKTSRAEARQTLEKIGRIISTQVALSSIATFDLKDYIYTNYLKKYLEKKIKNKDITLNAALEVLLAPEEKTFTQELRIVLIKLALAVKNGQKNYQAELETVQKEWCWINYGYRGPVMDYAFFAETLESLLKKALPDLQSELKNLEDWGQQIKNKKEKIFQKLEIDERHRQFIKALSVLSGLKVYHKDIAFMLIYAMYQILAPFNKKYKPADLCYLTFTEAKKMVEGKLELARAELLARETECVYFAEEDKVIVGKDCQKIIDSLVEKDPNLASDEKQRVKLLEGTAACLGETGDWVYGEAKIINASEDMKKMNPGDILVSVATAPDIVPAMRKAGAIVTDMGGITSHAAIVSRELNKPCLIGTKYATKLFKDGDKVIVCPRHGYIKFQ